MTSPTPSLTSAPVTHSISATLASLLLFEPDWQGLFLGSLHFLFIWLSPCSSQIADLLSSLLQIFFQTYFLTSVFLEHRFKIANLPFVPLALPIPLPFPTVLIILLFSL